MEIIDEEKKESKDGEMEVKITKKRKFKEIDDASLMADVKSEKDKEKDKQEFKKFRGNEEVDEPDEEIEIV